MNPGYYNNNNNNNNNKVDVQFPHILVLNSIPKEKVVGGGKV